MRTGGKTGIGADSRGGFAFQIESVTAIPKVMFFLYAAPTAEFTQIGVSIKRYPFRIVIETRFDGGTNHGLDGRFEVFEEGVIN